MPTNHAILSPSAAYRWLTCTPSARAEEGLPDKGSDFAKEGTLAHSVAEFLLRYYLEELLSDTFDNGLSAFAAAAERDPNTEAYLRATAQDAGFDIDEIIETVHARYVLVIYSQYLKATQEDVMTRWGIEEELNLNTFIPEGIGTADATLIHDEGKTTILDVYDLKYGKGVKVSADHNPQMMCYALGLLYSKAELYGVDVIRMHIIQPRLYHESNFEMKREDLVYWGVHILRPTADKAFKGEGQRVAGDHCKFCKCLPTCRIAMAHNREVAQTLDKPDTLTDDELNDALKSLEQIKTWISALETYALNRALDGKAVPGWKVVEGRSLRKIVDQAAAIQKLRDNGFDDATFLRPAELKTITELEKVLRKDGFKTLLGEFVVKPQGKPTLAPEDDPRQPMKRSAEEVFKGIDL